MDNKILGETIIRFLGEKKEKRWFVLGEDLYELIKNMGLVNDTESLYFVFNYLDEEKVYVDFQHSDSEIKKLYQSNSEYITKLNNHRKSVDRIKNLKPIFKKIMNKLGDKAYKENYDWLERYRDDDDDDNHFNMNI